MRIVQPNIGQEDKWRPGFDEEAARRLATLSGPPTGEPRLLLWPEAAITDPLEDARPDHQGVAEFQRMRAASLLGPNDVLLTGGIADRIARRRPRRSVRPTASSRSAPAARSSAATTRRTSFPTANICRCGRCCPPSACRGLRPAISTSRPAPGRARSIIGGEWGKVGFQLCYEIIFSGQVVDEQNRPDFIFNPSNDAWFGRWGPPQHLAQARLRAAEEGLPVLRATPTGHQRRDRCPRQGRQSDPWRTAGRDRRRASPRRGRAASVRALRQRHPAAARLLLLIAGGIVLGRTPPLEARHIKLSLYPEFEAAFTLMRSSISSLPNPCPKAIPTRSPTRFPTRSSTCSCPRTRRRASPARR